MEQTDEWIKKVHIMVPLQNEIKILLCFCYNLQF